MEQSPHFRMHHATLGWKSGGYAAAPRKTRGSGRSPPMVSPRARAIMLVRPPRPEGIARKHSAAGSHQRGIAMVRSYEETSGAGRGVAMSPACAIES